MKKNIFILGAVLLIFQGLQAQKTATGSWYGSADVEMAGIHNNYLTELIIRQKGNKVDGIFGYYFRDKYTSFFVHGSYNPKTREVRILNIPVIYFNSNSTVNSIDCNTNFLGKLLVSKVRSSLSGYFYHDERYKYTCPDLRVQYTLDKGEKKQDSILSNTTAGARIWKPEPDDYIVNASESPKVSDSTSGKIRTDSVSRSNNAEQASIPAQKNISPSPTHEDSMAVTAAKAKEEARIAADKAIEVARADAKKLAESFAKRKTTLTQELEVVSDSVRVSFYDNGIIDGDSISVFLNHQLILSHQELAAKALTLYVHLDSLKAVNEISMFAENLGKYPPNTALMIVTDGINRYEVFMSSSFTQNASILLKRKDR